MAPPESIWYRVGHAYERARQIGATSRGPVAGLAERKEAAADTSRKDPLANLPVGDELVAAGALFVLDRLVGRAGARAKPGIGRLVRAGAAGAAAAFLVDLVRPLIRGDGDVAVIDDGTLDRLLLGAAQGLVYGALVEPRVPGPALLKGAVYGSVEYAADPLGGLGEVLSSHTPQSKLPGLNGFLETLGAEERDYVEHVVFGIALALLYESSPSSNGIPSLPEDVEDDPDRT